MQLTRKLELPLEAARIRGLLDDPVRLLASVPGTDGSDTVRLLPRRGERPVQATVRVAAEVRPQAGGSVIDLACTLELTRPPSRDLSAAAELLADQLAANVEAELLDVVGAASEPPHPGGAATESHPPDPTDQPAVTGAARALRAVTRERAAAAVAVAAALALLAGLIRRRRHR